MKIKLLFMICACYFAFHTPLYSFPWSVIQGSTPKAPHLIDADVIETIGSAKITSDMSLDDKDLCARIDLLGYCSSQIETVDFNTVITPTKSCHIAVLVDDTAKLVVKDGDEMVGKIEMTNGQALWMDGSYAVASDFKLKANKTYSISLTYGNTCRRENDIDGISVYLIEAKPAAEVSIIIEEKDNDNVFSGLVTEKFEDEPMKYECKKDNKDAITDFEVTKLSVVKKNNVFGKKEIVSRGLILTMKTEVAKSIQSENPTQYSISVEDKDKNENKTIENFIFNWPSS